MKSQPAQLSAPVRVPCSSMITSKHSMEKFPAEMICWKRFAVMFRDVQETTHIPSAQAPATRMFINPIGFDAVPIKLRLKAGASK